MDDDKRYFDSDEFLELLKKYEQMRAQDICSYLEGDELYSLLIYFLQEKNIGEATTVCEYTKKLHPSDIELISKMEAQILLSSNNPQKALEKISRLPDDNDIETQILKAEILLSTKDYKGSYQTIINILQNNNLQSNEIYDALSIMLDCGFAQEALQIIDEHIEKRPKQRAFYEIKAECLIELQQTDAAIVIYNKLLDSTPYSTLYWEQLGRIYYMTERYAKSLECFEYEQTIDSTIEYAIMMQGFCYYHLHDYNHATEIFETLSEKYPQTPLYTFYIALSLTQQGKIAEAISQYAKIISIGADKNIETPEEILSLINIAIILDKNQNKEAAASCMNQVMLSNIDIDSAKQLLLGGTPFYELRDKEIMTFRDMNRMETREWKLYEIMQEFGINLFESGCRELALYPLYHAQAFAPDTAEIDAYIAYILHKSNGDSDELARLINSAIENRSNKLFELFEQPYKADITVEQFLKQIGR